MTSQPKVIFGGIGSRQSAGIRLLIVCLFVAVLCGCKPSYEDSGTEGAVPSSVAPELDAQIRQSTNGFIEAVQVGEFAKAASFLSPELQKQMPTAQLTQMAKSESLKPLTTASELRFDPIQLGAKGSRATVRLAFDNGDQKNYRMNFTLEKTGSDWKIRSLVPPTKHREPMQQNGATSAQK